MAFYRTNFIHQYVFVIFMASTIWEKCQADPLHQQTILCPPQLRQYPKQPCNTSTNCRYGGRCRKAADVSGRGTITRYIIPEESRDGRRLSRYENLAYWPSRHSEPTGSEICTCPYLCDSRRSRQICGTNGITYRSVCHLRRYSCRCQTDVQIHYPGPCMEDAEIDVEMQSSSPISSQSKVKMPMQGCAGRCQFGGRCDDEGRCQCNIHCQADESFVCGKDGKTYRNSCFLRRAQCEEQRGITIFHGGRCRHQHRRGAPTCFHSCNIKRSEEVCGSDGVTYLDECSLQRASCVRGKKIDVVHQGQCGEQPPVQSTKDPCRGITCEYEAICVPHPLFEFECSCDAICSEDEAQNDNNVRLSVASSPAGRSKWITNNRGHTNRGKKRRRGELNRKHRKHRRRGSRSKRSIDGSTAPRNVTLCGTDGKTYTNLCEMKIYACHSQTNVTVKHAGACPMILPQRRKQINPAKRPDIVEVPAEDTEMSLNPYATQTIKGRRHYSKARQIHKETHKALTTTVHTTTLTATVFYSSITTNRSKMTGLSDHADDTTTSVNIPARSDDVTNSIAASEVRGSARNPTRSALEILSHEATTTVNALGSPRLFTNNPSTAIENSAPNSSRQRSSSEIVERLLAATNSSRESDKKLGLIGEFESRDDTPGNNPTPCELKTVSPSLKWYHVALISIATQLVVVALLIGICIFWRRRCRSKSNDNFSNKNNTTEENPKERQGDESEKT